MHLEYLYNSLEREEICGTVYAVTKGSLLLLFPSLIKMTGVMDNCRDT